MLDFTVAIPCCNGANRLPKLLDQLRRQTGTENISWEILLIDNNSSDHIAQMVHDYQLHWPEAFPLKYCFEPQPGTAFARCRAIKEAQGELIGFLDDDNIPACDWVLTAYAFGKKYPQVGAYGSEIQGIFEEEIPQNFAKIFPFLAIRQHGSQAKQFEPAKLRLPPGAGLVVRKQAWLNCVPNTPKLIGSKGNSLARGDDYEPLLYIHKGGWQIWYNPAMKIDHLIPHWRLKRDYLLSLAWACGLATFQLEMIKAKNLQKPLIFLRMILGNLRRIIIHFFKYKYQLNNDIVVDFEMTFFWGSMNSPLFYVKNQLFQKR